MIPYFDAHCDTIYRCLETGETSALEYGEDREEQRRYYAAFQINFEAFEQLICEKTAAISIWNGD